MKNGGSGSGRALLQEGREGNAPEPGFPLRAIQGSTSGGKVRASLRLATCGGDGRNRTPLPAQPEPASGPVTRHNISPGCQT